MTVANVFIRPGVAHVFSDGGVRGPDGLLIAGRALTKVHLMPHLNAALVARGPARFSMMMGHALSQADTFDDAAAALARASREIAPHSRDRGTADEAMLCESIFVGWSEASGEPTAWIVSEVDRPELPAWEAMELTQVVTPPTEEPLANPVADPVGDAVEIMRSQRRAWPNEVGKFLQHTAIFRDRIVTRILERW